MADYSPDTDPRSSNSLIRAYLASKQMQPGNPNYAQAVRTALSANAANPGLIPGLVNSTPSTEADDQAAMAAARHGIGGNSRGAGLPIPPIPPGAPPPGGGGGGGGDTSAPPPSGGGGPSDDEISSALLASAIASGGGAGALLMKRALANRKPATPAAPHIAGVEGPGGQFELPLEGGKGAAPPRQGELPLQGGGPRVNQPELPLFGGGGPQQGDLFGPRSAAAPAAPVPPAPPAGPRSDIPFDAQGKPVYGGSPRGQPVQAPPITVHTGQPITSVEQFTAANPGASIPAPDPAVVSAPPQITDTVPAIDEAGARVRKPGRARASRARVPPRV
jgi:hypothetical protein